MTLLTAGQHRAIDRDYARLTGQPRRVERVYWWPDRCWVEYCVEVSLGKADPVTPADPQRFDRDGEGLFEVHATRKARALYAELARQHGTARELAERLDYSLSSVHGLLRSAHDQGRVRVLGRRGYVDSRGWQRYEQVWGLADAADIPDEYPAAIRALIDDGGWLTRADLAERTGLAQGGVYGQMRQYEDRLDVWVQEVVKGNRPYTVHYFRWRNEPAQTRG